MTVIIGIDPGSRITGYGLIEHNKTKNITYISSGCLYTRTKDFFSRLKKIYKETYKIIEKFKPNCLAIEQIFLAKNVQSTLKLSQARDVAIIIAINLELPIFEYATRKIKKTITGKGSAKKNQIQCMIQTLLKLSFHPKPDEADALAVAITHCYMKENIL